MSASADVRGWDPLVSGSLASVQAYSQLYNQIVQYDTGDTGIIACDLCSSWEVGNGGQAFTFNIRDDVWWLDGTALTAEDLAFSMQRYGELDSSAGRSGLWLGYTEDANAGGVNLIDDRAVEFNLRVTSQAFTKFLALDQAKVLPRHILEQDIDLNQAEGIIVNRSGSGPFVLDEYQWGDYYKVSKNENCFKQGRPFFDRIEHFIITDTSRLSAGFRSRQIDMSGSGLTVLTPAQAREGM